MVAFFVRYVQDTLEMQIADIAFSITQDLHMTKYFPLFLLIIISTLACKNDKEGKTDIAEADTKGMSFRPDWVDKVGAKPFTLKEDVFYVNDYGAIDDGSQLTTQAIQKPSMPVQKMAAEK